MYGENTKTIAIPIYRILPYPVMYCTSSLYTFFQQYSILYLCHNLRVVLALLCMDISTACSNKHTVSDWKVPFTMTTNFLLVRDNYPRYGPK